MARARRKKDRARLEAVAIALAALGLLAGCGGDARDGERPTAERLPPNQEAPIEDEAAAPSFVFPEGGECVSGIPQQTADKLEVAPSGALWLTVDERIVVIHDGIARSYGPPEQPFPTGGGLSIDAQDRVWISGYGGANAQDLLMVVADGQWRPVLPDQGTLFVGVTPDGSAWVARMERRRAMYDVAHGVQQVAPEMGEEITVPRDRGFFNVDRDGGLWMSTEEGMWRWGRGAWAGPYAGGGFTYDSRQRVLWASQDRDLVLFEWTGSSFEQRVLRGLERGNFIGFAPGLRQVWQLNRELSWVDDGTVVDTLRLPSPLAVTLGPDGRVYQNTLTAIYREENGAMVPIFNYLAPGETGASCP